MTMQEYMDEHGHDLPEDGFAEEILKKVGRKT